jgi:type IV pilus assembly protein PilX
MKTILQRRQHGAVLVVSLIMLLVMTLIAVSAMRTTTLEERMGGNTRNQETAFQAAEAVLRAGESNLQGYTAEPLAASEGPTNIWVLDAPDPDTANETPWWKESTRDQSWWHTNAVAYSGTLDGVGTDPMYLIEAVDFVRDSLNVGSQQDESGQVYYRLTARATGGNDLARALLQSTYARRY